MKADCFDYLRPFKAMQSQETYSRLANKTGNLKVQEFRDCILRTDYSRDGEKYKNQDNVYTCTSGVWAQITPPDLYNPDIQYVKGCTLFGGFYIAMWGHFLMETLARVWYLYQDNVEKIDKIIFVSDTPNYSGLHGNIARFLELTGWKDKIEIVASDIRCDRLIVPEMAITHFSYAKEFISVFDAVRANVLGNISHGQEETSKIFLTRSKLKDADKNEINITYLDRFFADNGYRILSPERFSLDKLIIELSSASELCSINGTLAHNVLFAPRGIRFNIIERHGFINSWQMVSNIVASTPAYYIDCYELPAMSNPIGSLFLYQSTDCMRRWARDSHLQEPCFPSSSKKRKKELRQFLKRCKLLNGHTPYFLPFDIKRGTVYAEAINDCEHIYAKWTRRQEPLFLSDYFSFRCHKNWWLGPMVRRLRTTIRKMRKG